MIAHDMPKLHGNKPLDGTAQPFFYGTRAIFGTRIGWVVPLQFPGNKVYATYLVNDKVTLISRKLAAGVTYAEVAPWPASPASIVSFPPASILGRSLPCRPLRFPLGYNGYHGVTLTAEGDLSTDERDGIAVEETTYKAFIVGTTDKDKFIRQIAGLDKKPAVVVMDETRNIVVTPTEDKILYAQAGQETVLVVTEKQFLVVDNPLV